MNTIGLFGVLAGSSVALAILLSSFFIGIKSKEYPHYIWSGLILLAVALRIGKSIFFFLLNDMAPIGLALGFIGLASLGPLTYFMIKKENNLSGRKAGHLVIPVLGAIGCFVVSPSPWETYFYQTATVILLGYLLVTWVIHLRSEEGAMKQWDRKVLVMVSGVWLALVYQHLADSMMNYAWGAIIAAGFLYWLFFQSFKTGVFPRGMAVELPDQVLGQVEQAFEKGGVYRETGLNLQQFSSQQDIPSYLVTRSVKKLYGKSFPETINFFRVEEVKQMLLDPKKEHLKIESLAYDVGFTSPSAFYAAFKKQTGQSPTEYQKAAARLTA